MDGRAERGGESNTQADVGQAMGLDEVTALRSANGRIT